MRRYSLISSCLVVSCLVFGLIQGEQFTESNRSLGESSPYLQKGMLAVAGVAAAVLIPLALGESLDDPTFVQRSFSSMARSWGLEECGQLAICDAHARYDDYGVIALPLVLMFPGAHDSEDESLTLYQMAAVKGKAREECTAEYSCLVNPMTVAKFFMTIFMK
ncbi:hypothetical protein TCAL_06145 [Tigriopus californicus]|uniref:Uncharacterized protein n=1 Tax=Tigriopus californicus TaxID=6832 RepID=A0A553PJJ8_TIGCA|nr:uncharacterized protein LOC131890525 [Tigriopus californicus]TRY77852.1 hypothetical protein TCAL_06145 [Tigriopus californicus]